MPAVLLCLYIFLIFIRPMDWWEPLMGWQLVNASAIVTILFSFQRILNEMRIIWTFPPVRVLFALLISASLSLLFWFGGVIATFQEFGKVCILYWLIVLLGRERKTYQMCLWTILLSVALMAVHGVMQVRLGAGFGGIEPIVRQTTTDAAPVIQIQAFGTFSDPNDLCLVFIVALPLLYAELKTTTNFLTKIACVIIIALAGYGAWLTNSRGGIVGIFGMLATYVIVRAKGLRRWLILAFSIGVVTLVLPSRASQMGSVDMNRIDLWGLGLDAFKAHPLLGIGYNMFKDLSNPMSAAHNSYITALSELGIIGYVLWVSIPFLTIVYMRRLLNLKHLISATDLWQLNALFAALSGYLTAIYFITRTYNHVLFILLAMALC